MKVLLLEDVEKLGRKGQVVTVKPGYMRPYLYPKGLAIPADKNALRMQEQLQKEREIKAVEERKEAESQAVKLKDVVLECVVKVDAEGHLYGSVSAADIIKMIHENVKLDLDKKAVDLSKPIKKLGMQQVPLKLKEGVVSAITLNVVAETGVETEQG